MVPLNGFSAHADKEEMMRFLKGCNLKVKKIALVHGEEHASLRFEELLGKEGFNVMVPKAGQVLKV